MTARPARLLALLALALGAAASLPSSAAAARATEPRFQLRLPSPGHVTVAALALTTRAARARRLPRRVWLGAPGARRLPPSVRVLLATRAIKVRGGYRYAAIVLVLRKAEASAAELVARAADDDHGPNMMHLIFGFGGAPWGVCKGCHGEGELVNEDRCDSCEIAKTSQAFMAAARKDADTASNRQLAPIRDLFRLDWSKDGGTVFEDFGGPPDPTLDTGHYDDGHAFGWGSPARPAPSEPEVRQVLIDLVEDVLRNEQRAIVPDVEQVARVDLDGDGTIGPRQRIDTRVGPPVIVG